MITIPLWSYIVDQVAILVLLVHAFILIKQIRKATKALREINEWYGKR